MKRESQLPAFKVGYSRHFIIWVVLLLIAVLLILARFTFINIATKGIGKVIPSKRVQLIANLEGGVVKKILIKEGDIVNQGQVLMYLDDVRFKSEYQESKLKELALQAKVERLNAQLKNEFFTPSPILKQSVPDIVANEESIFASKLKELNALKSREALIREEINLMQPLVKEGVISKVELLRLQREHEEIRGNISSFTSSANTELNQAKDELERIQQTNIGLKDRLERTVVRSPVHGVVKQLLINTEGGIVKPGVDLIQIIPLDDKLLIEARIKPSDIGFVQVNQNATVKITAYDYTIYGVLPGKVEHISADTTQDDKGNSYYDIWVRTNRDYLVSKGKKLQIIPGMTATVDIMTGQRSVLQYILKPVLRAKESLTER